MKFNLILVIGMLLAACSAPTPAASPLATAASTLAALAAPTTTAAPKATANPSVVAQPATCAPTSSDALGPFFTPGAPRRTRVDKGGYVLTGVVRSAKDCAPVARALLDFWLAAPNGEYDDAHRATLFAGADGAYRFESNAPVPYGGRPPHIHVRVTATGFQELVTQHYPRAGQTNATFDLVIISNR